jgi:hypothetical protein
MRGHFKYFINLESITYQVFIHRPKQYDGFDIIHSVYIIDNRVECTQVSSELTAEGVVLLKRMMNCSHSF